MKEFDLITFDCYGTLIDWETGIYEAFSSEAAKDGILIEREEVIAAYLAAEKEVEAGPYVPYRDVLTRSAHLAASTLGWKIDTERAAFLVASLPDWAPFADTNPALERLASRYHLGILSNVDDALLAETMRHLTVPFEVIVTAEQVRSYKPRRSHFEEAMRRKGSARWLHAGQSYFHDIGPTLEMGIRAAWINRKGEEISHGGRQPLYVVRDLMELAQLLPV